MTNTKYNINELLEKKKDIEQEINNIQINSSDLIYTKTTYIDTLNSKNNREIITRDKIDLENYTAKFYGLIEELTKIKTAIQEFNAKEVLGLLHQRTALREKINYLKIIKNNLKTDKKFNRTTTRQDERGQALEITEIMSEPMFELSKIEKWENELASQQRKINTEIQKLNLNAQIELKE